MSLAKHKTALFSKSVFYQCAKVWNNLDVMAKTTKNSVSKFRSLVDQLLLKVRAKKLGSGVQKGI